jgi:hypothetical protein
MMKKLIPFLSLILLVSCGEKGNSEKTESGNILENLTYSVDTVMVDPGEELINLSMGLFVSDVSKDSNYLYLFSQPEYSLTVINLDLLNIEKKIVFEKEGPNGIGAYIMDFKVLPDEKFMFASFGSAAVFDANSIKLEDISLKTNEHPELAVEDGQDLNFQINRGTDERYLYSLPGNFMEVERDLAVIDRSTKSAKLIDIPALDNTGKFSISFFSDGMREISLEEYYLDEYQGFLYLSSSVTSDLYRYDFQNDSLQLFSFPITVSPKEKTEFPKSEVSSKLEQQEESQKVHSQIAFNELMWDETRRLFFKIGSITKPSDSPDVPAIFSVFLYAFDTNMELVGETLVNDLKSIPESAFFKDGKLWSYVNVDDELGFEVFTFKLN